MTKTILHRVCISLVVCALAALPVQAQESVVVVNGASFQAGVPLAPGTWATAFADFASVGVVNTLAESIPFPDLLGGVQVFVDGTASPMNFVGGTQINFLVPGATAVGSQVPFRVEVAGNTTYEGSIAVASLSPGLISRNPADETRPGAVLNQDSTLNSQENPAQRGEVVQIFGVGGDFAELPADGAPAPGDRLISTNTLPTVYISIIEAALQFSGLAPNLVNAWQINVVVPDNPIVSGQVPVFATMSSDQAQAATNPVSIWVAQ